jgi:hypothetical protein
MRRRSPEGQRAGAAIVPSFRLRLLDVPDRVLGDVTELGREIERPLDVSDRFAPRRVVPSIVRINPLDDMEWVEVTRILYQSAIGISFER